MKGKRKQNGFLKIPGSVNMVNWDKEPLPHEKNYELPSYQWTPAAKLAGTIFINILP